MSLWMKKVLKTVEYFCTDCQATEILQIIKLVYSAVKTCAATERVLKLRFNVMEDRDYGLKDSELDYLFDAAPDLVERMIGLMRILELKVSDWTLIIFGLRISKECEKMLRDAVCVLRNDNGYNVHVNWREEGAVVDIVVRGDKEQAIHEPWIMTCRSCLSQKDIFQ